MNKDKLVMPSFEFWAILENHKLSYDMVGMGVINGIHYCELDNIHDELKDLILDKFDVENDFPANCSIDFVANNIVWQDGQTSFPETGQWDFPPHYEMEISVVEIAQQGVDYENNF